MYPGNSSSYVPRKQFLIPGTCNSHIAPEAGISIATFSTLQPFLLAMTVWVMHLHISLLPQETDHLLLWNNKTMPFDCFIDNLMFIGDFMFLLKALCSLIFKMLSFFSECKNTLPLEQLVSTRPTINPSINVHQIYFYRVEIVNTNNNTTHLPYCSLCT